MPIDDRPFWEALLIINNIPKENIREWNRNIHQVDFLGVNSSVVLETDSKKFHSERRLEDRIRDQYLRYEYGLEVIRYDGLEFENHLEEIQQKLSRYRPFGPLNFKEKSDEVFNCKYHLYLYNFKKLFEYRKEIINSESDIIVLTKKDLNILGWNQKLYTDLNNWFKIYCNKEFLYLDINIVLENLILKYINGERIPDQIYYLLKQLGYL